MRWSIECEHSFSDEIGFRGAFYPLDNTWGWFQDSVFSFVLILMGLKLEGLALSTGFRQEWWIYDVIMMKMMAELDPVSLQAVMSPFCSISAAYSGQHEASQSETSSLNETI